LYIKTLVLAVLLFLAELLEGGVEIFDFFFLCSSKFLGVKTVSLVV
jgi:hypothetical protein